MSPRVVLIGAPAVGKTEVGRRLAELLDCDFVDLDDRADELYAEAGWSRTGFEELRDRDGAEAAYADLELAIAHAVERVMTTSPGAVVALGAGHSHTRTTEATHRIANVLDDLPVVLLLAHAHVTEATAIIRERVAARGADDYRRGDRDLIAEWVDSAANRALADHPVDTHGRTPDETAAEIADLLQPGSHRV